MPYKDSQDIRARCRERYINDGLTNFTLLAELEGTTRQSVARWAKEEKWADQRTSHIITPDQLARHYRRVLAQLGAELEEKAANNLPIAPSTLDNVSKIVNALKKLDHDFDVAGNSVYFWKLLIQYISMLPNKQQLSKELREIYPGFMTFVENTH